MKIHSILLGEFCNDWFLKYSVSILQKKVAYSPQWIGFGEFKKMLFVNGKENGL